MDGGGGGGGGGGAAAAADDDDDDDDDDDEGINDITQADTWWVSGSNMHECDLTSVEKLCKDPGNPYL